METVSTESCAFGRPSNVPFLFNIPPPATPVWNAPEIQDVQMSDPSPARSEDGTNDIPPRPFSLGAVRRVRKHREMQLARRRKHKAGSEDDSDSSLSEEDKRQSQQLTSHSTHYTLNMSSPGADASHLPYTLLGLVNQGLVI